MIIPGVITHASNIVEHPELIAERITRFAKLVGRENVIAGSDCGFSSQATYNPEVHPTVVWAKFQAMAGRRTPGNEAALALINFCAFALWNNRTPELTPAKSERTPSLGSESLISFPNHPINFFRPLRAWRLCGRHSACRLRLRRAAFFAVKWSEKSKGTVVTRPYFVISGFFAVIFLLV